MSLSAASRHPSRTNNKNPIVCSASLNEDAMVKNYLQHSHTSVCTHLLMSYKLNHTVFRQKMKCLTHTLHTFLPFPTFSCNPPAFRSHSLHTFCWTLLCFSIYYRGLSAVLSEKSVSPARAVPLLLSVASHLPAHFIPPSHAQSFSLSPLLFIRWKPGSISPHPFYGIK